MHEKLNLDGPAVRRELERVTAEGAQVEATVTNEGVTAEVSKEIKGWNVAGYVKKLWQGPWIGGASIKKDL